MSFQRGRAAPWSFFARKNGSLKACVTHRIDEAPGNLLVSQPHHPCQELFRAKKERASLWHVRDPVAPGVYVIYFEAILFCSILACSMMWQDPVLRLFEVIHVKRPSMFFHIFFMRVYYASHAYSSQNLKNDSALCFSCFLLRFIGIFKCIFFYCC